LPVDEQTRAVITRWQAARGYPRTGFLNSLQLKALQSEIVATRVDSVDDGDDEPSRHSSRHHSGGGGGRHYRGGGGPGAFFGGMMGGLFRRQGSASKPKRKGGPYGPPFCPVGSGSTGDPRAFMLRKCSGPAGAIVHLKTISGRKAVAPAPRCGQQIGQMPI